MARKKTFREKRDQETDLPRVEPLTGKMVDRFGEGTILLPAALEIDVLMRQAKKGRLTTIQAIREFLAARHGATMTCPIVAGIHARICAGAAGEELAEGRVRVTPFWRTLKSNGELNEKYPGGLEGQAERLSVEGHDVYARGRRLFVADWERALIRLS